jgi:hypothetical protein
MKQETRKIYRSGIALRDNSLWNVSAVYDPPQNIYGNIFPASETAEKYGIDRLQAIVTPGDLFLEIEEMTKENYFSLLVGGEETNYELKDGKMTLSPQGRLTFAGKMIPSLVREKFPIKEITRQLPFDLVMRMIWMNFERTPSEEAQEMAWHQRVGDSWRRKCL